MGSQTLRLRVAAREMPATVTGCASTSVYVVNGDGDTNVASVAARDASSALP